MRFYHVIPIERKSKLQKKCQMHEKSFSYAINPNHPFLELQSGMATPLKAESRESVIHLKTALINASGSCET